MLMVYSKMYADYHHRYRVDAREVSRTPPGIAEERFVTGGQSHWHAH